MTSAPASPFRSTALPAVRPVVYLGPEDGTAPTGNDLVTWLRVNEISRTAGGRSLDHIVLTVDLGIDGLDRRLVDLATPTRFARQVEIWCPATDDEEDDLPLAWGELTIQEIQIDDRRESATVTARIEPYHFGSPLPGFTVYDPRTSTEKLVADDVPFNPSIDGTVEANRSSREHSEKGYRLWIDPESMRREPARTWQGATASLWSIDTALDALCKVCNPEETHLKNPAIADQSIFGEAAAFENVAVPRGAFLPSILDRLLSPFGYAWRLELTSDADGNLTKQIVVFKRGEGTEKELRLQRPDELLDLSKTNVSRLTTAHSIADLANVIKAEGSLQQREVTVELYRGWTEAEDALGLDVLTRDPLLKAVSEFQSHQNAWRLWVGNEAGDACGTRQTVAPIPAAPLDLTTVFDVVAPRRRKVEDCLTKDEEGHRRPAVLEYYDTGEEIWKQVPSEWGYTILPDQIGVYFSGDFPPAILYGNGNDARLRITGTITGDSRLAHTTDRRSTSPNRRDVTLHLDLSDRFHDRKRQTDGPLASQILAPHGSDERDDATTLEQYAEKVQAVEEAADLRVSILLHGLDFGYEIGDLLTRVNGRNISFNRNSATAAAKRYMQITGIRYLVEEQRTELLVDIGDTDPLAPLDLRQFGDLPRPGNDRLDGPAGNAPLAGG